MCDAAPVPTPRHSGAGVGLRCASVPVAVDDPAAVEIVWREFHPDPIAGRHPNAEPPHPACRIGDELVVVLQLDLEHRVGQGLGDDRVHDDGLLLLDLTLRILVPACGSPGTSTECC